MEDVPLKRKVLAGAGQKQNGQLLLKHDRNCIFSLTRSKLPTASRKARLVVSIWVGPLVWSPISTLPQAKIEHALKIQRHIVVV